MHHPIAILTAILAMVVAPALVTMRPYRADDVADEG
jgi:hypothetical protein